MDNSPLFADNGKLKDGLQEGEDYTFRAPETWRLLCKLYPGSGPEISSVILADGRLELYCLRYLVHRSSDLGGQPKEVQLSKEVNPFLVADHPEWKQIKCSCQPNAACRLAWQT